MRVDIPLLSYFVIRRFSFVQSACRRWFPTRAEIISEGAADGVSRAEAQRAQSFRRAFFLCFLPLGGSGWAGRAVFQ